MHGPRPAKQLLVHTFHLHVHFVPICFGPQICAAKVFVCQEIYGPSACYPVIIHLGAASSPNLRISGEVFLRGDQGASATTIGTRRGGKANNFEPWRRLPNCRGLRAGQKIRKPRRNMFLKHRGIRTSKGRQSIQEWRTGVRNSFV